MEERERQKITAQEPGIPETPEAMPDRPPLFSTWNSLYIFVLLLHALVIASLYIFTLNYQ